MSPEVTKALSEYEGLKLQEKEIEARLDALKVIIMPEVEVGKKYLGEKGAFEVVTKANWKFSPGLLKMKEDLKQAEADEIARGEATNTPTVYLKFTVNK